MCGGANRSNTGFHESKEVSSDSSNTYSSSSSSTSECMDRGAFYRLHSILLHTGTANGGHYKAYVMDGPTGKWLECNDSSVCELSPREEASLFSRKHASAATTATTIASAIVTATPNITPATDVNTAATDTTAAVTATPISGDCTGDCTVTDEIGVGGGSEGDTDDLKIPPFDSTDSPTSVRERTKKIVTLTDDILHENAYILLYSKLPKDAYKEISVADCIKTIDVPSTGEKVAATVLVDRCLAAIPVPLKDSILIKNEELKVLRRLYDVHRKLITFSVFYDNAEIAVVRGASLIDDAGKSEVKATNRNGLNCISMTVLNTDTLDDLLRQVCALLSIPLQSTAPQHFFRLRLYGEMSGRGGETYGSRGDEALSNLGFKVRTSFGPSVPSAPVVLRLECRTQDDAPFEEFSDRDMRLKIIVWSEAVERAVITCYDNDSELIENAAIVDSAVLLSDFNMDSPTSPSSNNTATIVVQAEVIEEATAPNVGLTEGKKPLDGPRTLNSAQYSKEVLLAATHEILVPGKLTATLGNLRQAVAILLEVESCDVILVFKSDRTVIELDIDQDHRSVGKAFGINPGDTLYTEINQSSQIASISEDVEIPSSSGRYRSSALNTLIRISSSITVKFDDPTGTKNKENNAIPDLDPNVDSNPVHDRTHTDDSDGTRTNFVKLSSHSTLKDLKSRISQKLKMCPVKDIFYLCKSSVAFAAQYKDESKSLSDLGMSDCTHVHIKVLFFTVISSCSSYSNYIIIRP